MGLFVASRVLVTGQDRVGRLTPQCRCLSAATILCAIKSTVLGVVLECGTTMQCACKTQAWEIWTKGGNIPEVESFARLPLSIKAFRLIPRTKSGPGPKDVISSSFSCAMYSPPCTLYTGRQCFILRLLCDSLWGKGTSFGRQTHQKNSIVVDSELGGPIVQPIRGLGCFRYLFICNAPLLFLCWCGFAGKQPGSLTAVVKGRLSLWGIRQLSHDDWIRQVTLPILLRESCTFQCVFFVCVGMSMCLLPVFLLEHAKISVLWNHPSSLLLPKFSPPTSTQLWHLVLPLSLAAALVGLIRSSAVAVNSLFCSN